MFYSLFSNHIFQASVLSFTANFPQNDEIINRILFTRIYMAVSIEIFAVQKEQRLKDFQTTCDQSEVSP